jgi:hypothetical protein
MRKQLAVKKQGHYNTSDWVFEDIFLGRFGILRENLSLTFSEHKKPVMNPIQHLTYWSNFVGVGLKPAPTSRSKLGEILKQS